MKKILLSALIAFSPVTVATIADDTDPADTSLSVQGDAKRGKSVFNRCRACHSLTAAPRHRVGPNLNELFGSTAGTKEGFKYSPALKKAGFVWTEGKLNAWLEKPKKFLPGNRMAFMGLRKEKDRLNLLAYLREATAAQ
ncbi:cytochrome c family protein [Temperatibacter marinus]|uniref:Cytochrome c family protein n=1 Tax=Temperatibacter marinus TaxID=1456591 RepID=A0AA52EG05_9PROT|nr:cytochrome c family protein [Temperatibacter marinus]WND02433.1 cytochrome c family protein [Temperatibacter marinus]